MKLYDLEKDPDDELRNIYYSHPEYAEIREELKRQLWREQERLGDAPHPSQPRPAGV